MSKAEEDKPQKVEETLVKASEFRYKRVQIRADGLVKSINKDGSLDIYNKSNGKLLRGIPSSIVLPWTDETTIQYSPPGLTLFANYRNSGEWLPGKITEERKDGKFTINYEDGKIETSVEKSRIRFEFASVSDKANKKSNSLWGSEVEWMDKGSNKWVTGRVISESDDGNVLQVKQGIDQDIEIVSRKEVKLLKSSSDSSSSKGNNSKVLKVILDDKVEVNRNNKGKWQYGKVVMVRTDGTFDIEYNDDGKIESNVVIENIRSRSDSKVRPEDNNNSNGNVSPTNNNSTNNNNKSPKVASTTKSSSSVSKDNNNDGDNTSTNARVVISSYWGPKVEVKSANNGAWKVGRVTGESQDDRFQITYDNNDDDNDNGDNGKELTELVSKEDIRLYKKKHTHTSNSGKLHLNTDLNEDGSRNTNNNRQTKKQPQQSSSAIDAVKFVKHDRVEVNYQGKGKWYPGRIAIVRTDGTYDIEYDDGETEDHVSGRYIALYDVRTNNSNSHNSNNNKSCNSQNNKNNRNSYNNDDDFANNNSSDSDVLIPLSEGQRVAVDYKGQGTFYHGRVVAVRAGGDKYDIELLDDGKIEVKVPRRFIQILSQPSSISSTQSQSSPSYANKNNNKMSSSPTGAGGRGAIKKYWGPKVYCNYRNLGKWRIGRVTGETRDGRFQITYENNKGNNSDEVEVEIVTKDDIKPYESTSFVGREEEECIESQQQQQQQQQQQLSPKQQQRRQRQSSPNSRGNNNNNNNNNNMRLAADYYDDDETYFRGRGRENNNARDDSPSRGRANSRDRSGSPNRRRGRNINNNEEPSESSLLLIDVGDRVEVSLSTADIGNRWVRGTVVLVRNTGIYDVEYDDGTIDIKINERYIRKLVNNKRNSNDKNYDNDITVSRERSSPKTRQSRDSNYNNRNDGDSSGYEEQDRRYNDNRRINNNTITHNDRSPSPASRSPNKRYVEDYNQEIIMSSARGTGGGGSTGSNNQKNSNSSNGNGRRSMSPSRRYYVEEDENDNVIVMSGSGLSKMKL